MACSLKSVFCVPELMNESMVLGLCPSRHGKAKSRTTCSVLSTGFMGKSIALANEKGSGYCSSRTSRNAPIMVCEETFAFCVFYLAFCFSFFTFYFNPLFQAQSSICISRTLKWWKKNLKPNMIEIHSAQELVSSLLNAGDSLVVVDFYSPGCGGCKALHPKVFK